MKPYEEWIKDEEPQYWEDLTPLDSYILHKAYDYAVQIAELEETINTMKGAILYGNRKFRKAEGENMRLKDKIKDTFASWYVDTQDKELYERELKKQIAAARSLCDKFCADQCEEGPEWGECEGCGCSMFAIKATLGEAG